MKEITKEAYLVKVCKELKAVVSSRSQKDTKTRTARKANGRKHGSANKTNTMTKSGMKFHSRNLKLSAKKTSKKRLSVSQPSTNARMFQISQP